MESLPQQLEGLDGVKQPSVLVQKELRVLGVLLHQGSVDVLVYEVRYASDETSFRLLFCFDSGSIWDLGGLKKDTWNGFRSLISLFVQLLTLGRATKMTSFDRWL